MKDETVARLEQFIANRDHMKTIYKMELDMMYLACASIYTMRGKEVDEGILLQCKSLLKNRVGSFSNFRSNARMPITCMLALSRNPEETLEHALEVYKLLKQNLSRSDYLPMASMIIAEQVAPEEYERIAARTAAIYKRMKKQHRFLTSYEDSTFCTLMALSDKSDDVLLRDAETCFDMLKEEKFSSNAVQSLSHVLALCNESPSEKCRRTLELYYKLKDEGYKYGKYYELPTLGVLATTEANLSDIVCDMKEIDKWLAKQKGFGFFGISRKERLMIAGILAEKEYLNAEAMEAATINTTLSIILAQELAMCAAISASVASAAVNN